MEDDKEERYLIDQLRALQESYALAAKPYTDRLVEIRSLRPVPDPIFLTMAQAEGSGIGIDRLKRLTGVDGEGLQSIDVSAIINVG